MSDLEPKQAGIAAPESALPGEPRLYVCPVETLAESAARVKARSLITLINAQMMAELRTPETIGPERHLRLVMNDIVEPREDMILPNAGHVQALLDFVARWPQDGPLLINCRAGRSRSAAAAYIAVCALNPQADERAVAALLRQASTAATPNRLLIEIADDLMNRGGRMADAIAAIGEGGPADGRLFSLPARLTV
jgi:predicted protein tyrosine phosphatase